MSVEKVREYFKQYGIEEQILEFETSSATVELAAKALGVKPGLIAKTLSFMANDTPILIVTAGDAKINNAKYKAKFSKKAKMLKPDEVTEYIGHDIGGVCPFAVKPGVDIYLDVSLKKYDYVYPACGSSNSAIKLSPDELAKYCPYKEWIDVCKTSNEQ